MLTNRYLTEIAEKKLQSKMLLLTGPRQCGKTTLSRQLFANLPDQQKLYFNWDITDDRRMILEGKLPNKCQYVIYDEIHKYAHWRNYIKGAFDKLKDQTKILVTGSARLDLYRKSGESLQGRYYLLRMHGYSLKEVIDYRLGSLEELRYFRDTDKREVDFVILRNRKPILFVECKLSDTKVSDSLRYLKAKFPKVDAVQVVYHANQDLRNKDDIRIVSATTFLNEFV